MMVRNAVPAWDLPASETLNTDNALLCVSAIPHGGVEPPAIEAHI